MSGFACPEIFSIPEAPIDYNLKKLEIALAEIVIFGANKIVCTKCAIPLLSACRLFYLYKKVPARQTSPIDKTEGLK